MSNEKKRGGDAPVQVELKTGKNYAFCTCGHSANQPFCDGGHKGTGFVPQIFKVGEDEDAWLCTCKETKDAPYCDGSHNQTS